MYRLYDQRDRLIYVGISGNPEIRFRQHAADKDWWPQVARHEIEWFNSRMGALAAEKAAIRTKGPLYNRDHSPEWPRIPITLEISENWLQALDIFCDALGMTETFSRKERRETALWALLERELKARALLGDPSCYHGSVPWPDGVTAVRAGERCSCGRVIVPDCNPWADLAEPAA